MFLCGREVKGLVTQPGTGNRLRTRICPTMVLHSHGLRGTTLGLYEKKEEMPLRCLGGARMGICGDQEAENRQCDPSAPQNQWR